ncbi:MAG: hypothetical protein U5M51_09275 [Emticicia sp.]|nr:hypothetical protein [Emticicia sp.]
MRASFTKKIETLIKAKEKLSDAEMNDGNAMMKKAMGMDAKAIEFSTTANSVMGTYYASIYRTTQHHLAKTIKSVGNRKNEKRNSKN